MNLSSFLTILALTHLSSHSSTYPWAAWPLVVETSQGSGEIQPVPSPHPLPPRCPEHRQMCNVSHWGQAGTPLSSVELWGRRRNGRCICKMHMSLNRSSAIQCFTQDSSSKYAMSQILCVQVCTCKFGHFCCKNIFA